jgi:hypothetical protein
MLVDTEVLVADECWIALASLHRSKPQRASFSAQEILERLKQEKACPELRPGVPPHIYLHNVANLKPNSARYRMFYRLADGTYRLFRPGDDFDPTRRGKTCPDRMELPPRYRELLDWYEQEYCSSSLESLEESDPILGMVGVGKEIWADEGGDAFVARERAGWSENSEERKVTIAPTDRMEKVWKRILRHQGQEFHTVQRRPFTYSVEAQNGLWFYRDGKRINKKLWCGEIEKAVARCPLRSLQDVSDCFDSSYLFGLLTDPRITNNEW